MVLQGPSSGEQLAGKRVLGYYFAPYNQLLQVSPESLTTLGVPGASRTQAVLSVTFLLKHAP